MLQNNPDWQKLTNKQKRRFLWRIRFGVLFEFAIAPGWWLIASVALTAFYLVAIHPPMHHWLEIPAIFGASLSTLVITYSVGDMVLGRLK